VLANRAQGLSPEAVLDCFISGLKTDIKRDVIAQTPSSLSRAFSLAKLYEDKYFPPPPNPSSAPTHKPYHYPTPYPIPRNQPPPPILPSHQAKPPNQPLKYNPICNITRAEMQLRREKGLGCYCDDKFSITHKCPNHHFLLLQVDEEDAIPHFSETPDSPTPQPSHVGDFEHHLSLNALNGSHGAGTLCFHGQIQGVHVSVLLDSGSSDNFLQPRIAHCLNIPIESTEQFKVMVGNGNSLETMGYIVELPVIVQGHTLQLPV
jgi:hypothetical protein